MAAASKKTGASEEAPRRGPPPGETPTRAGIKYSKKRLEIASRKMISPRAPLSGSDFYFWKILASHFLNNILTIKCIDNVYIILYNIYTKQGRKEKWKRK